ncbi:S23A2-like protein, partial [Mya arenaria]
QALLALSGSLVVSLLVAEAVCASDDDAVKAKLFSSTLFMNGASSEYIVPLLLMKTDGNNFCSNTVGNSGNARANAVNATGSVLSAGNTDVVLDNIRSGSLMLAGLLHAFLGFTGLIGILLRFIGPLTVVPTLLLIFIFISKPVIKFLEVSWPISLSTIAIGLILSLYLTKYQMPVPVWTRKKGFHIIRYPVHQVFSILISIIVNWVLCAVLTHFNVLTNDVNDVGYKARTDSRLDIIHSNPWFNFPYPGQFGVPGFSSAAFLSFLIATFISVLDSIGDYFACARICRVPAPPSHAVNRGILMEGIGTFFSGAMGCGHATSTNGGCLGAISVASRQVFVFVGILYLLFGIFGKFCAVFITIPYPVLGGAICILFGNFFGVIISNLEVTNMHAGRNIAILGVSTFIGLTIPSWAQSVGKPVNTGYTNVDTICGMLLGNPNLTGSLLAFFLDNTVPGSRKDRGIDAWQVKDEEEEVDRTVYLEGYEVYQPLCPRRWLGWRVMNYTPFMPYKPRHRGDYDLAL